MIERVFIKQGIRKIELESYLKKELERAGFTGLDIVKTPLVTRLVLNVARPGLAIGKEGQNIKQLTDEIGKRFGIENPQLEIQETPHAGLNATAVVNKMVSLLERGYSWRSVAFRTVRDIMGAGAQGVELMLSGKLAGKGGRKRKQRVAEGYMKKVGNQTKLVDYAKASAYPKAGAIGIKLRIIRPGVIFPDKVDVKQAVQAPAEEAGEKEEAPVKGEEEKKEAAGKGSEEKEAAAEVPGKEKKAEKPVKRKGRGKAKEAQETPKEKKKKHAGEKKKTAAKKSGKEKKPAAEKKKTGAKKSGKEKKAGAVNEAE